jgi:hypothetical protein
VFRFCDGFDSYAASADLTKKWDSNAGSWTWQSTAGVNGGGAIQLAAAVGGLITKTILSGDMTSGSSHFWGISFWLKISAAPASSQSLLYMTIAGGSNPITGQGFGVNSSGQACFCGSSVTAISAASSVNVCDNNWHHIEVKGIPSISGSCVLYVDGTQVSTATGAANGTSVLTVRSIGASSTVTIDDIVVWDDSGSTYNSSPVGQRTIETLRPSAAGDETDFSHTGGASNYQSVNETNSDEDTSYVSDSTAGHFDLYQFGDLGSTPTTITAVVVNHRTRSVTSGQPNMRAKAKSVSTISNGTTVAAATLGYSNYQQEFVTDPNTSAAWAGAAVNAAQFGLELVS